MTFWITSCSSPSAISCGSGSSRAAGSYPFVDLAEVAQLHMAGTTYYHDYLGRLGLEWHFCNWQRQGKWPMQGCENLETHQAKEWREEFGKYLLSPNGILEIMDGWESVILDSHPFARGVHEVYLMKNAIANWHAFAKSPYINCKYTLYAWCIFTRGMMSPLLLILRVPLSL